MSDDPLSHPIWAALSTSHRSLAQTLGRARRYPAAVAPYAALDPHAARTGEATGALEDLRQLLEPGEGILLAGERPSALAGLQWGDTIPCLQMIFPADVPLPDPIPGISVQPLGCAEGPEMMDLIAIAYPGYFRAETCRMGRYFGVRDPGGRLIAMGGERLCLHLPGQPPWHEVSGLCSHPDYASKGLGTAVLRQILATQRATGACSWLWVAEGNRRAVSLYRRLGFRTTARTELHRLHRLPALGPVRGC